MAHLVSDGVRQRDPVVFVDVAAAPGLTHTPDMRHPECAARLVLTRADVLSETNHSIC